MAAKRQSPSVRQKEAEAKATKRKSHKYVRHNMAAKCQSPSVQQKEAEAKEAKHQLGTPIEKEERRQKDATSKKR